jgi:hypothetical protein
VALVLSAFLFPFVCACYYPSPMAANLSFLLYSSGLIILPSIRMGVRMFWMMFLGVFANCWRVSNGGVKCLSITFLKLYL